MSSEAELLVSVHKAFMNFDKRAERASSDVLAATFVDSAPLFDLLNTKNNQVIYGRRGTGKTHALKYLAEKVEAEGDRAVYLDLRSIGSNTSLYSDASRPLAERANTLILDVIAALNNEFYSIALEVIDTVPDAGQITIRLDELAQAITTVRISGSVEAERSAESESSSARKVGASLNAGTTTPAVNFSASLEGQDKVGRHERLKRSGDEIVYLNFGQIHSAISGLIAVLNSPRIWLLVDEWSEIPVDLQPYLADLVRRTILPQGNITIKIAAIEHRSRFSLARDAGEYVGLELGADVSADLNLDDFLVFENNQVKATNFFVKLIYNHYKNSEMSDPALQSPEKLIQLAFTQWPVFEEFVRAVEGVPRDALNLAAKIATKAYGQKIGMQHVRNAARDWYQQDKAAVIRNDPELSKLLETIIDDVLGNRKARAFLFPSSIREPRIDKLFDSRLLHVLKKSISSHDEPGVRYDVYKIDYGCYVDQINTSRAPTGLLEVEEGEHDEVPRDDYRSIRRAILRLQ
jgi:hypothetical protein